MRWIALSVLFCGSLALVAQTAPNASTPEPTGGVQQVESEKADKKPSRLKRLKDHVKDHFSEGCIKAVASGCWDKEKQEGENGEQGNTGPVASKREPGPPRSTDATHAGESSSKETKIDLSAPPGDAADHPLSEDESGVGEMQKWNPMRAMKNLEVGDYYYKQKNYRAAQSRYSEALEWKPNDAAATYKLAAAEEKLGNTAAALKGYEEYLRILPSGPFAEDAKKGIERVRTGNPQEATNRKVE